MGTTSRMVFLVLAGCFGESPHGTCADDKDEQVRKALAQLEGEWEMVSSFSRGEKSPPYPGAKPGVPLRITFRDGKTTLSCDGKVLVTGTVKIDPSRSPMWLDSIPDLPNKKTIPHPGIFEVSDKEYKVCLGQPGKDRPTKFVSDKESGTFLATFKRVK